MGRPRGKTLRQQLVLPIERALGNRQIGLTADDIARRPRRLCFKLHSLQLRRGQLGLGIGERNLKRRRIDPEQDIPALDPLTFLDVDLDHGSVDLRADRGDVLLHIGIVGAHGLATVEPEPAADQQDQQRDGKQQHDPLGIALGDDDRFVDHAIGRGRQGGIPRGVVTRRIGGLVLAADFLHLVHAETLVGDWSMRDTLSRIRSRPSRI